MRILYWHRTLGDGAEGVHITSMIEAFRTLGHDVRLARIAGTGEGHAAAPAGLVGRVRSHLPGPLFELASIGYNLPEYLHMRRAIASYRPDVVYARHARYATAALLAARHSRVPSLLEVNALFTAPGYAQFEPLAFAGVARRMERTSLRAATAVITVSSPLTRQAAAVAGIAARTIANGADPHRFDAARCDRAGVRARLRLGTSLVIGWTGIMRDWHGLDRLLELLTIIPSAVLLLVGDGPAREALLRRAAERGLDGRVIVTGRVPHEEVPSYLAAMDIALVADERTGVASPMKLLEYMAMGLAVVAPAADNIRDVVDHEKDGLLFDAEGPGDLLAQVRRFADDAALRQTCGRQARLKIERERNWVAVASTALGALGPRYDPVR